MDADLLTRLLAKREETLALNRAAERTRGSGWHPGDLGAEARDRANELLLSERPVALQVDDRVYFVGGCVGPVRAACRDYAARVGPAIAKEPWAYVRRAAELAARVGAGDGPVVELPTRDFNGVLHALAEEGVQVVTTGA